MNSANLNENEINSHEFDLLDQIHDVAELSALEDMVNIADEVIEVTTKYEVGTEIMERIKKKFGENITIVKKIDPTLLGGIIIKRGDQYFNGSVESQLKNLKRKLHKL